MDVELVVIRKISGVGFFSFHVMHIQLKKYLLLDLH